MKKIILTLYVLIIIKKCAKATEFNTLDVQQWNDFKVQFEKKYVTTEEEQQKMKVFKDNTDKIAKHNELFKKGEVSFEMGMNKFGDMTHEEFKQKVLAAELKTTYVTVPSSKIISSLPPNSGPVPKKKNWSTDGAVTNIKEQTPECGCCWAFAIAAAIEGQFAIRNKKRVSFSVQQFLDCTGTREGMNNDCSEGFMFFALQYAVENQGIDTYHSYPYEAQVNKCRYNAENKAVVVKDYRVIVPNNEKLMKDIVGTIGPIACNFYATEEFIQFYKSGIYSDSKCKKDTINHSFLIVGYDVDEASGTEYWIIKNQWGKSWGIEGYAHIFRNSNECAIATECYFPII